MSDVKFITRDGLKSARKASKNEIPGYMDIVYFQEEILQDYEGNRKYNLEDLGNSIFLSTTDDSWSIPHGLFRPEKGYVAVHIGDLGFLPSAELCKWKEHNVHPKTIETQKYYYDFRSSIGRIIHFMNSTNKFIKDYFERYLSDVSTSDYRLFKLDDLESTLNRLRSCINANTTRDELQTRIIFLNILTLETINSRLISRTLCKVDKELCLPTEAIALNEIIGRYLFKRTPPELIKKARYFSAQPLKGLELLKKFILFLLMYNEELMRSGVNDLSSLTRSKKQVYLKLKEDFEKWYEYQIYGKSFDNVDSFLKKEKIILNGTASLKLLNKFRSETAAHGFTKSKYEKLIEKFGVTESNNYLQVYEKVIEKVSYDVEHILLELITPGPPILEYFKKALAENLEIMEESEDYRLAFEDIHYILREFPQLYNEMKSGLKRIFRIKNEDENFIIELGIFVELLSMDLKEKSQELVDYVIEGYKYVGALTLAHISHMIKNSDELSRKFLSKIYPLILENLMTDDKNVQSSSQHALWCLLEKFPEKVNLEDIKTKISTVDISFTPLKDYID